MPIIRKKLDPEEVFPNSIRWDGDPPVFQTTTDGGATWDVNPLADPRHDPTYLLPPLTTYDGIECDVAARMAAQLEATLDIFIESVDATQFAIAIIAILSFPFGIVGWLLGLAIFVGDALIDIGQSNIESAFTDAVYADIACTFECYIDANGQLTQTNLDLAYDKIAADHPGVVANTINELRFFYGDVAMCNAGTSRDEMGDCGDCDSCEWFVEYDFSAGDQRGWSVFFDTIYVYGAYDGVRFVDSAVYGRRAVFVFKRMPGTHLTGYQLKIDAGHGTGTGNLFQIEKEDGATTNPPTGRHILAGPTSGFSLSAGWHAAVTGLSWDVSDGFSFFWYCDTNGTGHVDLSALRLSGTGAPPPGGVRVSGWHA